MNPSDLALPVKFAAWRVGQEDAVIDAAVALTDKRFYMLSMPTGGGKSAVYMGIAKALGARALVLTGTKGLQAQLIADFRDMGLKEIKGQANYPCLAADDGGKETTCADGDCHFGYDCCLFVNGCRYYDALRVANRASIVVTNYAYWMSINRYSDPDTLGEFDLLILDEAHDAPEYLAEFCAIEIDKVELHALLGLDLPSLHDGQDVWSEWAEEAYVRAMSALESAKEDIKFARTSSNKRRVRRLSNITNKLMSLANRNKMRRGEPANPTVYVPGQLTDWVAEEVYDKLHKLKAAKFSPVWAHAYAEDYLFCRVPKVLMVSATLQRQAAKYLGVAPDAYTFRETPSTFDPKRRPLIWAPTVRVSANISTGEQRIWLRKIDAIIEKRLDRKGIIHTRSYDRAQAILIGSRHRDIMLSHGSRTAGDAVAEFKRSSAPRVFVSPSMETGWDFPYDQCEYQIIAKVPFPDTRTGVMKARVASDKKYQNYVTVLSLVQQYGRGMRAEDDSCETIIIDDHIEWFWPAAKEFWPKWFASAYKKFPGIPPPLPKLKRRVA